MTTAEFISHLASLDIKVWPNGDLLGYNAVRGTMTPALRTELAERKRDLLAYLREHGATGPGAGARLTRCEREAEMPLSFAQVRLWFLELLEPGSPLHVRVKGLRIRGDLDVARLMSALDTLAVRHEALRSSFQAPVRRGLLAMTWSAAPLAAAR